MKIHAFIAHAGLTSRRKAEELVSEGKVSVNGSVAHIGQQIDPERDQVSVNGKKITFGEVVVIYLIDKPVGVVSTTSDELQRTTVVDFLRRQLPIEERDHLPRLYPVGRLDRDSEGLMLLTNDGSLTQRLTHPSYSVEKTYDITIEGHPTDKALAHLRRGVRLEEGITALANVEVIGEQSETTRLEVTIHEGRYHQVKRMLRRVGYEVIKLRRIRMGEYTVDMLAGKPYKRVEAK